MTTDDKAPPRGALEEAVSLVDELLPIARGFAKELVNTDDRKEVEQQIADIQRRRAALEPRLARRRDNQAKPRGEKA